MEIKSFAPSERARYTEEQERETSYHTQMAQLAAKKTELEKRISALPLNHDFIGEQNPEEALRISNVALQHIEEEKTRLEQERVGTLALFTQFPEKVYTCIMDQASLQTKKALSLVSHAWKSRSIESLRHEYDCFIQQKLDQYIYIHKLSTKDARFSHSSDVHSQEVLLELEAIKKEHITLTTPPTFQNLKEKLIEFRDRIFTTLTKVDDVSKIPRTIVPSEQDSRYLPSMAFHFIDVMFTERRGRIFFPIFSLQWQQMQKEHIALAMTLIKMGDTKNALRFIKEEMSNSSALECIKLLLDAHDITSAKLIYSHKFDIRPTFRGPPPPGMLGPDPDNITITQSEAVRLIAVREATKDLDRVLQHGNLEEALREVALSRPLQAIDTLEDRYFINAITDIAGAIAEKGYEAIALEFAEKKLQEKRIDIGSTSAYTKIAVGLAKAGNIDRALELSTQIGLPCELEDITYAVLKKHGITKALECLEGFCSKTSDARTIQRAFKKIVFEALNLCTIDDGILTVNSIEDQEIKNAILTEWAEKIVRTGNVDGALKIAHSIQDTNHRDWTLERIASFLVEGGNNSLILKAVDIAEDHITNSSYKDRIFERIAIQLAKNGDITSAKIIGDFIDFFLTKHVVFKDVALSLAQNHGVEKALEFINTLSDEEQRQARAALEYTLPPSR